MRLGFDLHDGPIQDVLALAGETRRLREQVYPFVLETHRELAHGRFDDLSARLVELDRQLREIAHSLETKSIVSRPLGEILHREVDAFAERTGIEAEVEIRGDPDSLSSAQRITVFRAIQEALANVREHAAPPPSTCASGRGAARSRCRSWTTASASRSSARSRRPRSAAASASSASASASAWSAARSRSRAARAARRRSASRCRGGALHRRRRQVTRAVVVQAPACLRGQGSPHTHATAPPTREPGRQAEACHHCSGSAGRGERLAHRQSWVPALRPSSSSTRAATGFSLSPGSRAGPTPTPPHPPRGNRRQAEACHHRGSPPWRASRAPASRRPPRTRPRRSEAASRVPARRRNPGRARPPARGDRLQPVSRVTAPRSCLIDTAIEPRRARSSRLDPPPLLPECAGTHAETARKQRLVGGREDRTVQIRHRRVDCVVVRQGVLLGQFRGTSQHVR